jgi:hypothetical protein
LETGTNDGIPGGQDVGQNGFLHRRNEDLNNNQPRRDESQSRKVGRQNKSQ